MLATAGLFACGKAADGDAGGDGKSVSDRQRQEAELAALDDGTALIAAEAEARAPAAQCGAGSACRGGLLAGAWEVLADCSSAPRPRRTLQAFGKPFLALDSEACRGALRLESEWSGGFTFEQGLFQDQRQRTDHVELDLTPECMSATLGKAIRQQQLGPACASLGKSMSECAVVDGVCHCSGSNDEQLSHVGIYGVLDQRDTAQVVIASDADPQTDEPKDYVDYCVEGDLLHWRQPADSVELVLRRVAGPEPAEVPHIR
ncbi:MAG TPA: hypothetical protein VFS67_29045 [Polyangiaceae bacterium]|nr:hypothetical protein [Polyangiaceae bacterium]